MPLPRASGPEPFEEVGGRGGKRGGGMGEETAERRREGRGRGRRSKSGVEKEEERERRRN